MGERDHWPQIIKDVGFDFSWDNGKVWRLDVPVTEMDVAGLSWHFDIPFLWEGNGIYNLTPREVLEHPDTHPEEFERTMAVDTSHPIDVMENNGRWLILDGLHRLMKAALDGQGIVRVRKIPRGKISEILK